MHRENLSLGRRRVLAGGLATGSILLLGGCATVSRWTYEEVIRRLLERAANRAFARLTAPDGFWNSSVARLALPEIFGRRGRVVESILMSPLTRERMQRLFNRFAEDGARRAAPLVADAVRAVGRENAMAILKGGPRAATAMLHQQMGGALVDAMVPALGDAIQIAEDPLLNQLISAVTGISPGDAARSLAGDVDRAIWAEIGAAEEEIRANPESTNDPVLISALRSR